MDVKKTLDEAFALISRIPVSGDDVELMAAAKAKLRAVYKALDEKEGEDG